jgi:hypothetical protein
MRRRWKRIVVTAVVLGLPAAALAGTYTATSSGPITVPKTTGNASPYPSTINVPTSSTIQNVRVQLNNVAQLGMPNSVDIALQHGATTVMIVSDAGDTQAVDGVSPIFDKAGTDFSASACEPAVNPVFPSAGPYKPINCAPNATDFCADTPSADTFPSPGPGVVPAGTPNLGAFDGGNQQGDWSLWIVTDCDHPGVPGTQTIASWTLTITNANATAVRLVDFAAKRTGAAVAVRWKAANESDIVGYNVWRVAAGKAVKLNRSLVPARSAGRAGSSSYRVADRFGARTAVTYRLQALDVSGKRSWLATTSLSAAG